MKRPVAGGGQRTGRMGQPNDQGDYTIDLDAAVAFLTALDPEARYWTFQTFDDDKDRIARLKAEQETKGRKFFDPRAKVLHGSLDELHDDLRRRNADRAGIFVTVNATDGKGRTKANVIRIRALFVDLDGAPLEPVLEAERPPHIVVESSPGKSHCYWRVGNCRLDQAEPALRQLTERFGGDRQCCERARVLRLPGFWHRKAAPHQVRMIRCEPGCYSLADLVSLPTEERGREPMSSSVVLPFSSVTLPCTSVDEAIKQCLPDDVGQRNRCLFELARRLKALLPDAEPSELRPIVQRWHRQALPVIGTEPFPASWDDFTRAWPAVCHPFGATLAAIVEAAKQAELPDSLAELGYGDATSRRLVLICREMQRKEGDRPFFISCRTAADLLGVDHVAAAKMLRAMVADEILELIEKGAGNRASRYRYVWRN